MWFAGEGGQCLRDFLDVGFDVGGGCCGVAGAGMAGIGAGHRVSEVPFYPGQRGVAQPVSADLLGRDPGQMPADALPQVVVPAVGDRAAVAIAQ
jgi:hypothetical protein